MPGTIRHFLRHWPQTEMLFLGGYFSVPLAQLCHIQNIGYKQRNVPGKWLPAFCRPCIFWDTVSESLQKGFLTLSTHASVTCRETRDLDLHVVRWSERVRECCLAILVALVIRSSWDKPQYHATLSAREAVVEAGGTVNNGKKRHFAPKWSRPAVSKLRPAGQSQNGHPWSWPSSQLKCCCIDTVHSG